MESLDAFATADLAKFAAFFRSAEHDVLHPARDHGIPHDVRAHTAEEVDQNDRRFEDHALDLVAAVRPAAVPVQVVEVGHDLLDIVLAEASELEGVRVLERHVHAEKKRNAVHVGEALPPRQREDARMMRGIVPYVWHP